MSETLTDDFSGDENPVTKIISESIPVTEDLQVNLQVRHSKSGIEKN